MRNHINYAVIDLSRGDFEEYYNGLANRVLWPILHYRVDLQEYSRADHSGYMRVNRQFADKLSAGALIVNPHERDAVTAALKRALGMYCSSDANATARCWNISWSTTSSSGRRLSCCARGDAAAPELDERTARIPHSFEVVDRSACNPRRA